VKRIFSKTRQLNAPKRATTLIGIISISSILSGFLLFYTNETLNLNIYRSYCGEHGFYGKSLVLLKDSTFRFSYNGCSQSKGYISGTWNINGNFLELSPEIDDDLLDSKYVLKNNDLLSLKKTKDEGFLDCSN